MNKFYFNTADWGWISPYDSGYLAIEDLDTREGFALSSFDDLCNYLVICRFHGVYIDFIREALVNCANELGCIYRNVDELVRDISEYYI